jgi:hypothetical protein
VKSNSARVGIAHSCQFEGKGSVSGGIWQRTEDEKWEPHDYRVMITGVAFAGGVSVSR